MRTSFVSIVTCAVTTLFIGVHAQETPRPDTGDLPANGGAVIDKTRPAAPTGSAATAPRVSATAASSPASAASGVMRKRHPASGPR